MDSFKVDLYDTFLAKDLLMLSDSECEREVFSYLDSIANYKNLNDLILYSEKLNEMKSEYKFDKKGTSLKLANIIDNSIFCRSGMVECLEKLRHQK
jgi:hypothetical protein